MRRANCQLYEDPMRALLGVPQTMECEITTSKHTRKWAAKKDAFFVDAPGSVGENRIVRWPGGL